MKENVQLKDLNVSCNSLKEVDLKDLCTFVRENYELIHLDLSHCEIQPEKLEKIVKKVKKSKTLMCIHLCGNPGILKPEFTSYVLDQLP